MLRRDYFLKLNTICEGQKAISGAGVTQNRKPTFESLYKEGKTLDAINKYYSQTPP
jgi:hypothetical protein